MSGTDFRLRAFLADISLGAARPLALEAEAVGLSGPWQFFPEARFMRAKFLTPLVSIVLACTCFLARAQDAVFSGGTSKSTVSAPADSPARSGLRSVGGSWQRQSSPDSSSSTVGTYNSPQAQRSDSPRNPAVTTANYEQTRDGAMASASGTTHAGIARQASNDLVTSEASRDIERSSERIPLAAPQPNSNEAVQKSGSWMQMVVSVGSSLLIVIGLFLGVAWCYRRAQCNSLSGALPKHVVQVLGKTPLAARQQLMLVRFGPKLVLVSLVQGEVRTISEISDPLEVDRLTGHCESQQAGSVSQSFRSMLSQGVTS